jgi:hypothetical protein
MKILSCPTWPRMPPSCRMNRQMSLHCWDRHIFICPIIYATVRTREVKCGLVGLVDLFNQSIKPTKQRPSRVLLLCSGHFEHDRTHESSPSMYF